MSSKEKVFLDYINSQKEISDTDKKILILMLEFWLKINDVDKVTFDKLLKELGYKEEYNIEDLIKNSIYNRRHNKFFDTFVLRSIIKSLIVDKEKREIYLNQIR